jgi:hypothetical protein
MRFFDGTCTRYRGYFPGLINNSVGINTLPPTSEVIDKLNTEVNAALDDPRIRERFAEQGSTAMTGSSADFFRRSPWFVSGCPSSL